jgi:Arc/MetJ family transcription regulator
MAVGRGGRSLAVLLNPFEITHFSGGRIAGEKFPAGQTGWGNGTGFQLSPFFLLIFNVLKDALLRYQAAFPAGTTMCILLPPDTHWMLSMRTNIEIDDELIRAAMDVSGLKTKRAAVEEGLRLLIKLKRPDEVKALFGRVPWEGDFDESRLGRTLPE